MLKKGGKSIIRPLSKYHFIVKIALLLAPLLAFANPISYSVDFEGLEDAKLLKAVRGASQLISLRKKPPSSLTALRFRAESDLPQLLILLQAAGYLEAAADIAIEEQFPDYIVFIKIHLGPLYTIEEFQVSLQTSEPSIYYPSLQMDNLNLSKNAPAETKTILDAELTAIQILSECGYPLSIVKNREIVADGNTKTVKVFLKLDPGPLSYFGEATLDGNISVSPLFIEQYLKWHKGELYNSSLVEQTQKALMNTGLFSSVYITHSAELNAEKELPLKIEVAETKHKSISLGASYQTTYGAGATIGWENRNVGGMGRKMSLQADVAQRTHSGTASYLIPNFRRLGQNYMIQASAEHDTLTAYHDQSYSLLNRFDRQAGYFFFSIGAKGEYLIVSNSVMNGSSMLIEAPIYMRFTNVVDFLNPLKGIRLDYTLEPTLNMKGHGYFYLSQVFSLATYLPLRQNAIFVLAQKITLGSILSNGLEAVPVPKRFLGGSEDNLRGYKYLTVSPLSEEGKPIGGRSAIYYTLEPRLRLSRSFGLVPFFDIGNVFESELPDFIGKWRKSAGLGIRYFSFMGPLRLDLAFPLNRRKGIDPSWWIFVSVGQTF